MVILDMKVISILLDLKIVYLLGFEHGFQRDTIVLPFL